MSAARDGKQLLFSIGVAAARTGMHPQTLREYERKGLVTPVRTPGGARRYSDVELRRLLRIQQLTEQGLSHAGVEYVLGLELRIEQLEHQLSHYETVEHAIAPIPTAPQQALLPIKHSMSLEIIHVPRPRRRPRWRNY